MRDEEKQILKDLAISLKLVDLRGDPKLDEVVYNLFELCGMLELPVANIELNYVCSVNCSSLTVIVDRFKSTLRRLSVEGCDQVDSECVRTICQLSDLTHLNLSHCTLLGDADLHLITRHLPNITSLQLDGLNHLSDRYCIL